MILLPGPIFALIGCLLTVVFFEALYTPLKADPAFSISKALACAGWWTFVIIVSSIILILRCGSIAFFFNLPFFVVVAVSHYQLAVKEEGIISLREVATNIPTAFRTCIDWLKRFSRK